MSFVLSVVNLRSGPLMDDCIFWNRLLSNLVSVNLKPVCQTSKITGALARETVLRDPQVTSNPNSRRGFSLVCLYYVVEPPT